MTIRGRGSIGQAGLVVGVRSGEDPAPDLHLAGAPQSPNDWRSRLILLIGGDRVPPPGPNTRVAGRCALGAICDTNDWSSHD